MASDDDALEHKLRQNLKLRRELVAKAEAAIDAKQGSAMAFRLGWALYWLGVFLALTWIIGLMLGGALNVSPC